jgi:peroxiredoxin
MIKTKSTFLIVIVAIIASSAGFLLQHNIQQKQASYRPDFALVDTEGNSRSIAEFDGKVILLNFWAAWCPPCKEEMPDFVRLQEDFAEQGFVVLGIAIDTLDNAQTFMDTVGVNYPVLMAEREGVKLAQQYGNRLGALPYTVIIDRRGHIVSSHIAKINYQQVAELIKPLL